jgi:hypothetical protein
MVHLSYEDENTNQLVGKPQPARVNERRYHACITADIKLPSPSMSATPSRSRKIFSANIPRYERLF